MRPKRTDDKYWTGTRDFNHIQYESDLEDYIIDLENEVLKKIENNKTTDTIKTTFDLRTCFTNMQNDEGFVGLSKTQWEEILKQVEK